MHLSRLVLIEPPYLRLANGIYSLVKYPLSLGYLAGAVRSTLDWDVLVVNADYSPACQALNMSYHLGDDYEQYRAQLADLSRPLWQEIQAVIAEYRPSVVGISAKSPTFAAACALARLVKRVDPEIRVVLGGPHATITREQVFGCLDIDVCVVGEGEHTLVELLQAIEGKRSLAGVNGILYRDGNRILATPPRPMERDLDSLAFPHIYAREVLKDYASYPLKAFRHLFAARGCLRNCSFCASRAVWGGHPRTRTPRNVTREVRGLRKLGLKAVHFDDDLFGVMPRYFRTLLAALGEDCGGVRWSCETHVQCITDDNVERMKAAGCYMIQLGIESGNNAILRKMRKGFTVAEAEAACERIQRHDLSLEAFILIGFPDETEESLRDTHALIERIPTEKIICSLFTPYPGTDAYRFCQEQGLIGARFDPAYPANHFCRQLAPERYRELAAEIRGLVEDKNRLGLARRSRRYANLFAGEDRVQEGSCLP